MARVALKTVAARAMHDPAFFEALRDDPAAALAAAGMSVSSDDMVTMKKYLKSEARRFNIDPVKLIAWANPRINNNGPDQWDIDWGAGWK